jgi:hypothetical protein
MNPMDQYPPRPEVTPEMVREAAKDVAERMGGNVDDIVEAYSHPMDGYELGKELEKWHWWDVGRGDIDTLDEVEMNVNDALKLAEEQWIKENNIQPPYPVGAVVECKSRRRIGVIDGVCNYSPGCYLIKPNEPDETEQDNNCRWVCRFEGVTPVNEEQAA